MTRLGVIWTSLSVTFSIFSSLHIYWLILVCSGWASFFNKCAFWFFAEIPWLEFIHFFNNNLHFIIHLARLTRDHSFSMLATFSKRLTFNRGLEMLVFRKILRTYVLSDWSSTIWCFYFRRNEVAEDILNFYHLNTNLLIYTAYLE